MVIDYNKLEESPVDLLDNTLTVLEQVPGFTVTRDLTSYLRDRKYWMSYNRAFYPETYNLTHTQKLVDQYGDWFSHKNTSRANIIMREQAKVLKHFQTKHF